MTNRPDLDRRPSSDAEWGELLQPRWSAVGSRLDAEGLRALIVTGCGTLHQYGYLEYVTGYCPWQRRGYAVLAPAHDPVFIAPTVGDAEAARALDGGPQVLLGQGDDSLPNSVAALLIDFGVTRGMVGIVGSHLMPVADFELIKRLVPGLELRDATALLAQIKTTKSPVELEEIRRAAAIADAGMRAFEEVASGANIQESCAAVEQVVRGRGARETIIRLGSGPHFALPPSPAAIRRGDLLSAYVEIAGPTGYWIELVRLIAVGELDQSRTRLLEPVMDFAPQK